MKQDRSLLEQNLIQPTLKVKRRRGVVKDIQKYLAEKHDIFDGLVQTWINNPSEELKNIDTRLLYLFDSQIYNKTGDPEIDPSKFFTEAEEKRSKQYSGKMYLKDEIKFPLHFDYALQNSRDVWVVMMDIRTVVGLLKSRKLNWNPESQREATYKVINGEIIETPTIIMPNVYQMKKLLKNGKLEQTQLIWNCSLGTSDSGEEVIFDENTHKLIVTEGTKIDIVDGMNRTMAAELALAENPNIDFKFEVKILNFTVPRAAEYLAQISKGERMSETKRRSMSKETDADIITKELMEKSELRDRVSKKEMITKKRKELVTYNTLVSSIDKNFKIEKKIDRVEIQNYLIEFFDMLLGYYEEQFTTNYNETRKISLLAENLMFAGYVVLAANMKQNNIDPSQVKKYIDKIDFSKSNPLWKERNILDQKENWTKHARNEIEKYFSEIEIGDEL